MLTEAQKRAHRNYDKKCKLFCIRLNREKDDDVITWISQQASANEMIKSLIRQNIARKKK